MSGGPVPLLKLPPVSLYVHIPWCVRKCPYCDFNSHAADTEIPQGQYIDALIRDFRAEAGMLQGRSLGSIFFGGGTPSLFEPAQLGRLLDTIRGIASIHADAEITLEANPGTVEQARFSGFREAGINRLSIGVQSFDDTFLQALGRIHDGAEAQAAFEAARAAGFENINLDLMHGLPGQSEAQAVADLRRAIGLGPEHLSWYQLTIEPNTEFYSRPPDLPDDIHLESIETAGLEVLDRANYQRYEVSAYARPDRKSRHNLNYWQFGDYIGIGAGAHGKWTRPEHGELIRTAKSRQPAAYLQAVFPQTQLRRVIEPGERSLEFMMNWLRLGEPLDLALFSARTGIAAEALQPAIDQAIQRGLMDAERLQPTALGMRFLNQLVGIFQA